MEGSGANAKYYVQLGADAASKKQLGNEDSMFKDIAYIFKDGVFYDNVASHTLYSASINADGNILSNDKYNGVYGTIVNPTAYKYLTIKVKASINLGDIQYGVGSSNAKLPGLSSTGANRLHYSSNEMYTDEWSYQTMLCRATAPVYYVANYCEVSTIFLHNGLI